MNTILVLHDISDLRSGEPPMRVPKHLLAEIIRHLGLAPDATPEPAQIVSLLGENHEALVRVATRLENAPWNAYEAALTVSLTDQEARPSVEAAAARYRLALDDRTIAPLLMRRATYNAIMDRSQKDGYERNYADKYAKFFADLVRDYVVLIEAEAPTAQYNLAAALLAPIITPHLINPKDSQ